MRQPAVTLLVAAALVSSPARATSLREQLQMAKDDKDEYAQIEIVRRILEAEPEDPALRRELVDLWLQAGDPQMAQAALDAWKSAPDDYRQKAQARIMCEDDRSDEAMGVLENYLAKNPADLEAVGMLAEYYASAGENQKTVALLSSDAASRQGYLLLMRADARRALGEFDAALRDFQSAKARGAAEDHDRAAPYERLAQVAAEIKPTDEKVRANPADWASALRAAWLREYIIIGGQTPEIARVSEIAWKANPEAASTKIYYAKYTSDGAAQVKHLGVNRGAPAISREDLEGLILLDQALAKNPKDARLLVRRARALGDMKQSDLALADAKAALILAPKEPEAHLQLISATVAARSLPEARALVPAFEKLNPPPAQLAALHQALAEAALKTFNLGFALDQAGKAIAIKPTVTLYELRAAILERMGRSEEAKEDLAAAKKLP